MTSQSDKLKGLAEEFAAARGVKEAARLRRQCTLAEWELVLAEAKRIYFAKSLKSRFTN